MTSDNMYLKSEPTHASNIWAKDQDASLATFGYVPKEMYSEKDLTSILMESGLFLLGAQTSRKNNNFSGYHSMFLCAVLAFDVVDKVIISGNYERSLDRSRDFRGLYNLLLDTISKEENKSKVLLSRELIN